ncbi:fumarylacetoacetate hydrolase family protein [Profundibacterium mesophilum]|uniref:Acylpyruvate hydrolase n=1 Tax=Profundibacterium mesophilum KAUST100406-0324 TaxID=1037889 RepID=A0A921TBP9_9RHOB|nr:fumarylacetoacetate hydrolase family protein [Profundibacterium mesophilum]KAF0676020.1 acylpyruvate hydrolase [Profundibacterium mesophilum KAUST100406-0324]
MTEFAFAPPPVPFVPVAGGRRFAVRRIFCVGRNYADHAREMGHDPEREPPFFFCKPADAVLHDGATLPYPQGTQELHHEGELVVAIGGAGRNIDTGSALGHVFGYAAGNDLTRRDLQARAKALGRPWDMAKGFDGSALIGEISPAERIGHPARGRITLSVNGAPRQEADLADQIWSVPEIIAHLSALVALAPGDLVMTGTPAGVGALVPGDLCRTQIEGLAPAELRIGEGGPPQAG